MGRGGEAAVAAYLKKRKIKVLETNYVCRLGEADLVARQGDTILFVEVKTRSSDTYGTPAEAVGPAKQRKYAAVAAFYLAEKKLPDSAVRFDVAEVTDGVVNYIENAFFAPSKF